MQVVAIGAIKGGVGKSTAAANLALVAAESGLRTILWDLDRQGASCHLLDIECVSPIAPKSRWFRKRPGYSDPVVSGHHPLLRVIPGGTTTDVEQRVNALRDDADLVLLDLPAGLDGPVLGALAVADQILVPVVASDLSLRAFDQLVRFTDGTRTRAFASMFDSTKRRHQEFHQQLQTGSREVCSTVIPAAVEVERACEQRVPVTRAFPKGRAARAYRDLWAEIS